MQARARSTSVNRALPECGLWSQHDSMRSPFQSLLLVAAASMAIGVEAFAFEADGFKSGMSIKEVEAELRSRGILPRGHGEGNYWRILTPISDQKIPFRQFEFCGNRLYRYKSHPSGGFDVFVRMTDAEIEKKGRPLFDARLNALDQPQVTAQWTMGGSILRVILSKDDDFSITREWTDPAVREPCA